MSLVPDGYVVGLVRDAHSEETRVSHLYEGDYADPGWPMCARGWNRGYGTDYSIWRGQMGLGICKVCHRRASQGLPPVPPKKRKSEIGG